MSNYLEELADDLFTDIIHREDQLPTDIGDVYRMADLAPEPQDLVDALNILINSNKIIGYGKILNRQAYLNVEKIIRDE